MLNKGWVGDYLASRVRINGSSVALYDIDADREFTYNDLNERANGLANYLKKELLIEKGDRIAYISRNRVELIDGYYATGKLGAVMVPYNARLSSDELEELIKNEEPRVLIYEEIFSDKVDALKKEVDIEEYIILAEEENNEYELKIKRDNSSIYCEDLDFEDIHLIIHTGGTTGLPKGGMISHRAQLFNSMNEICTWGINYEDSAHIILPLFHTGGWNLLTLPILHAGGKIIINRDFNPKLTLEVIEKEKTTMIFGAATIFRMISDLPEFESADLSSLKWAMAGAAPTPINIMERFWDKGVKFVLGYGMTEAGPNNLSTAAQFVDEKEMKEKFASVGKPMYLTQVKIIDDYGEEVQTGEVGELLWSGPQLFSGYWKNEEETKKTFIDGWVHSGDMAREDEDGYYYIVGRKKNMYISGGENVFPPEVENEIYKIPEIKEVCVFGVEDDKWGEVGKAVISFKPGKNISKEDILVILKDRLASYKVPKYIEFVDDIPKNNVGKIVISEIIKLYGESDDG